MADDMCDIAATPEQRFVLMLLERINALEDRCARLEAPRCSFFDALTNRFMPGGEALLWDPLEPSSAAQSTAGSSTSLTLTAAQLDAPVCLGLLRGASGNDLKLPLAVASQRLSERMWMGMHAVSLPAAGLTVRKLIDAVHAFYYTTASDGPVVLNACHDNAMDYLERVAGDEGDFDAETARFALAELRSCDTPLTSAAFVRAIDRDRERPVQRRAHLRAGPGDDLYLQCDWTHL